MNVKFHRKNGQIKWGTLFWITYAFMFPFWIANIFFDNDAAGVIQMCILFIALMFLFVDMIQMRQRHKQWEKIWREEMDIMKEWGWSQDEKKMKRLQKLKKEREKLS